MIYINQVLQYSADSKRIRIIEMDEPYVFIVDIDATSSMPKKEIYSNLATEIQQSELLVVSDPYAKVVSDIDLTEVQIRKREEDWEIIQQHCLQHMEMLLQKQGREMKIREIAEKTNLSPFKIKKLLSRYWQRGMTKNALLPDYSNSGGKGKAKDLTKEKVGRPRKVNIDNEYQVGINITDEVKVQFELAINISILTDIKKMEK
ncbi:hypothetical protein UB32_13930 [Mesobacillus subterraneus]|uniref:Uncharacterized protein n=2 Tax=Mesobacillus TaxID=2675231 RepID=A0A0D6ZA23_9BACI|nr:hypothetical protein UB32_13930 [Mesobacillus subterraneus]MDQ0415758.1 GTPase involved in cell partitioning and DNA repair [Mesobacillus stamsii]